MFWFGLIIGLCIGTVAGFALCAVLTVSKLNDK